MRYDIVLFDADGTLFDYEKAEENALELACRDAGMFLPMDGLRSAYREINRNIWEQFERGEITLGKLRTERWRRFFECVSFAGDPAAMSERYLRRLAEGWYLLPGAEETVSRLAPSCRMAIITNGIREVQIPRLAASPLAPYIRHIIVSEDAGFPKPDRRIFEHAFSVMGIRPVPTGRVIMVGDSLSSDIAGGIAAGIATCWFNPPGSPNASGVEPDFEIRSLPELVPIVEGS